MPSCLTAASEFLLPQYVRRPFPDDQEGCTALWLAYTNHLYEMSKERVCSVFHVPRLGKTFSFSDFNTRAGRETKLCRVAQLALSRKNVKPHKIYLLSKAQVPALSLTSLRFLNWINTKTKREMSNFYTNVRLIPMLTLRTSFLKLQNYKTFYISQQVKNF